MITIKVHRLLISIILVPLPEFPEIYLRMAECTEFQIRFLYFGFVHLVSACFASVIVSGHDWFATDYAGWEIAATAPA